MRVYVSADIEGTTGIADWDEALPRNRDYGPWRERMVAEVRAVVRGARSGGATDVWVKDAHAHARNLRPEDLPRATLIRGWSGHPAMMIQELDASFSALLCVGYHSPAGTSGHPLAHTLAGAYAEVRVNGALISEFLLNARQAATHGVPAVFLAGDAALCASAKTALPGLVTVPTHRGAGLSTIGRPLEAVLEALEEGAERAVRSAATAVAVAPQGPFTLQVRFRRPMHAVVASHYPGAEAIGEHSARLTVDTWLELLAALMFWYRAAG